MAATDTSDRECSVLTVCTTDEFETLRPSHNQDRECAALRVCIVDVQYETVPNTVATDRECGDLTYAPILG